MLNPGFSTALEVRDENAPRPATASSKTRMKPHPGRRADCVSLLDESRCPDGETRNGTLKAVFFPRISADL